MIHITKLTWKEDFAIDNEDLRKKLFPLTIEIKSDITIIVGANGSGKSRLLKAIDTTDQYEKYQKSKNPKLYLNEPTGKLEITKKENEPDWAIAKFETKDILESTKVSGDILQIARYFQSNGETRNLLIDRIKYTAESLRKQNLKGVMLIDELDSGLDYMNQRRFAEVLKNCTDVFQFIVVSHNFPFISEFDEVYDMDTLKYRNTKEYLNSILKGII